MIPTSVPGLFIRLTLEDNGEQGVMSWIKGQDVVINAYLHPDAVAILKREFEVK